MVGFDSVVDASYARCERTMPTTEPHDAQPVFGTVHWITGLAGAGKSTLGRLLAERLRNEGRVVVFLDGDELREKLYSEAGYTQAERLALARRHAGLCELLSAQGLDVVCATISLFPEIWSRNRRRLRNYREILVRAPLEVRRQRRPEIYAAAAERGPIVGVDIPAPQPPRPHVVLENDGSRSPELVVLELSRELDRQRDMPREIAATTAALDLDACTKAETLERLEPLVRCSRVLAQVRFEVRDWRADPRGVLARLEEKGWFERALIVRSSARVEHRAGMSHAGRFLSIAGQRGREDVSRAIERVAASLPDPRGGDQVFVQPDLERVESSGVVFTRDPNNGGHYSIVAYDTQSRRTDQITSGRAREWRTFVQHESAPPPADPMLERVLAMARELRELCGGVELDLEYACIDSELPFLLQVRPLCMQGAPADDVAGEACALARIRERILDLGRPHPYLPGGRPIFGAMPDWNPAEILGARPRPLALSLYRELITDGIWAYQRRNYGYRDLRSFPLMVSLGGLPYVDVRVSFHSFVPADLDEELGARLVDEYTRRLLASPPDHDKVEFKIVYSCATLDLARRLEPLAAQGFSADERERIAASLRDLTNRITSGPDSLFRVDLRKVAELERRQALFASTASAQSPLARAYWRLEDCKRYGTLPFAGIARAAFIALQLLDSLVETGILEPGEREAFLRGSSSARARMDRDLVHLSRKDFLARYGHLRPGTYEITSPRYDEAPELYFGAEHGGTQDDGVRPGRFQLDAARRKRLERELAAQGLAHDAESLLEFIGDAIDGREQAKFVFTRSLSDALVDLAEVARAAGFSREDLSYAEIDVLRALHASAVDGRELLARSVAAGRERHAITRRLSLPALITAPAQVLAFHLSPAEPSYVTQGRAEGPVQSSAASIESLRGSIVLIPSADPGYDWIFAHGIAGFLTQYGGYNSHMAVRALELGIPAVIGAGESLFQRCAAARRLRIDCPGRVVEVLA